MIVVLIDDRDGDRRAGEPARGVETAETSADDDDAREVRVCPPLTILVCRIHTALLSLRPTPRRSVLLDARCAPASPRRNDGRGLEPWRGERDPHGRRR